MDLISRKSAINTVINMRNRCGNDINDFYDLLIESFKVLPPVEPKTGNWNLHKSGASFICSACEETCLRMVRYCQNCGTKMLEILADSESEDKE